MQKYKHFSSDKIYNVFHKKSDNFMKLVCFLRLLIKHLTKHKRLKCKNSN